MYTIPDYCNHPEREGRTCRGCKESLNPALFDGGCKRLLGEGGGVQISTTPQLQNRPTTPREFPLNSKTDL